MLIRMPHRRTLLKWLHWKVVPLFIWFLFVTPDDVIPFGPGAFHFHSFLGLVFVTLSVLWTIGLIRRGLTGRAGPKLSARGQRLHQTLHKVLIWGLFGVAFTGLLMGITASRQLWAGGLVPVGTPLGLTDWNHIAGVVHIYEFYILAAVVIFHAGFHIWRHIRLKDNALRIMFPKALHRFL